MSPVRNADIADLLNNIGDILEIEGESVFRIRAYRDAARSIESLRTPIEEIIKRGELSSISGVGESIGAKVKEYVETGRSTYYEELSKQVKPGIAELLAVPGVGPRKARMFSEKLGIDSVDKLEEAARNHRLSALPSIGEKTELNILQSIERIHSRSGRIPLGTAFSAAIPFLEAVRGFEEVDQADFAGSLRRMRETIGDLDIMASSEEPQKVIAQFIELPWVKYVLVKGPTKCTIVNQDDLQIDLRVVKPDEYGAGLQYFTGSKAHNIKLREIAIAKGLKVNEYGIFRVSDNKKIAGAMEAEIYSTLGMLSIPPELREDRGEIEASMQGHLPVLVELADIKGDLHVHSDWSDGTDTLEDMVRGAISLGYEYIVLSDHSVSMGFIHGLSLERIKEQRELIDNLNGKYPQISIFQGIEVNIRADGSLDYGDDVLDSFDVVTASVHTGMNMPRDRMTARLIKTISNPSVDIIGHPTGRILDKRTPYDVDMEAVFNAAKQNETALEVNAQPERLDLNDVDSRNARDIGVMLAINSDAHSVEQLDLMRFGVAVARRGWVTRDNVVNASPLRDFLNWISR